MKAVNYDGEMFIIEEVQVFQHRESIKILRFSNVTVISYCRNCLVSFNMDLLVRSKMLITMVKIMVEISSNFSTVLLLFLLQLRH